MMGANGVTSEVGNGITDQLALSEQEFRPPLACRRSSCPPPSPNLVRIHPIERYQDLRDSAPFLSRATTPPEGHQIGARKRRAPE
ncbi:unnamed protein product, partial [Ascophyllum nodosum]